MSYNRHWIRASEIGDYLYCRRAWWLKQARGVRPVRTRAMQAGEQYHQGHGRRVRRAALMRAAAYVLIFCVVAIVVFQVLAG